MFKLLRYYSLTSFVAILAAAVLLTWFYRQVAIDGVFHVAERSNRDLAHLAMTTIRPGLLEFLAATADAKPGQQLPPLPAALAREIAELMHEENYVARIKIYNLQGVVVFSTSRRQIGGDQSRNEGVLAAARGETTSELVYRDRFNSFDEGNEEDNLVQTYLPVRAEPNGPVRGVFELYADVNPLIHQVERMQLIVIVGAIPILMALYLALVLIVRHANRTIEQQQQTIHERNETLALMSAHMLRNQESQNQQVAFELHEGVAQTLAALKLKAEKGLSRRAPREPREAGDSIIPMLQDAIEEVRTIATDLHPSSLEDLGLLPTLNSLVREFEQRHGGMSIEQRHSLREQDIPSTLRGILYRVVAAVLDDVAGQAEQARLVLALAREGGTLVLLIDVKLAPDPEANGGAAVAPLATRFSQMEHLAILSGGAFLASPRADGGTTLRAAWRVS